MDDKDQKDDQKVPKKTLINPFRKIPEGMFEEQRENAKKQGLKNAILYFGDDAIEAYNKRQEAKKNASSTSESLRGCIHKEKKLNCGYEKRYLKQKSISD